MEKKINSQAAKELSSAGVQVQFYPSNQVLHAKMIVTDSSVLKQAQADFETMYAK